MAVGINRYWKMPLGYFLIEGLNGAERSNLLRNCLQLLNETGTKHCSGQQLLNTHKDQAIALIINQYLNLRYQHAASIKEKKKSVSMRKKYTKLILFRNE
jgi:ABC-type Mn2+/Zn2+ transport system ATPase subunit